MKKYFFYATAAIVALASCQKEPAVTTPVDENAPVAMQLGANSATFSVTKTKAAVEDWNNTNIYVYAIDNTGEALIQNYHTQVVDANTNLAIYSNASFDGTIDPTIDPAPTKAAPYFYGENLVYDFYGYHVGDAVADPVPTKDDATGVYTLPVTFNGSQDLMVATTDKNADITTAANPDVTDPNTVYSAWSARRNVVPVLKFNHALTRFNFIVKGMNSNSTSVTINGISLESIASGILTVAGTTDLAFVADDTAGETTLSLKNADDTGFTATAVTTTASTAGGDGACIMFNPGMTEVPVIVTMSNNEYDNASIPSYEFTVKATDVMAIGGGSANATAFEAGKAYNIYINVYGPQEIEVKAELTPWEVAGEYTYDPDTAPVI